MDLKKKWLLHLGIGWVKFFFSTAPIKNVPIASTVKSRGLQ